MCSYNHQASVSGELAGPNPLSSDCFSYTFDPVLAKEAQEKTARIFWERFSSLIAPLTPFFLLEKLPHEKESLEQLQPSCHHEGGSGSQGEGRAKRWMSLSPRGSLRDTTPIP